MSCSAAHASLPVTAHVVARRVGLLLIVLATLLSVACARSSGAADGARDSGATLRIVSVGGAVTESVFALGAGDQVVGVDSSSVFPEAATKLPQIGYQRTLSAEGILALRPTLIVVSAEAGPPAVLEQLRATGIRLEVLRGEPSVVGARERIARIAELLGRDPSRILATMDADVEKARAQAAKATSRPKVLVLYARGGNTLHVFGRNNAADAMIQLAGGENAASGFEGSKPLTSEALVRAAPDVIVIPSLGLEGVGGIAGLLQVAGVSETPAGKEKRVVAMDDLLLLGFGPRTGQAVLELWEKVHPEIGKGPQ
jgi:iron complex transport system substrate-binding protein